MDIHNQVRQGIANGRQLERAGQNGAAIQQARQALERAEATQDFELINEARLSLGVIECQRGHFGEATDLARQVIAGSASNPGHLAHAWALLGRCTARVGSIKEADDQFQRAIDFTREASDESLHALILHELASSVYIPRGQFTLAFDSDEECIRILEQSGQQELIYRPLITQAWAALESGQYELARIRLDELEVKAPAGSTADGYRRSMAGFLALQMGRTAEAHHQYQQARSIAETTGDPSLNVYVRIGFSRVYTSFGQDSSALAWADEAVEYAERLNIRLFLGKALIVRAKARYHVRDWEGIESDLRQAVDVLRLLGANFDHARAVLLLAALLQNNGHPEAYSCWVEAVRLIQRGGFSLLMAQEREAAYRLLAASLDHPDEEPRRLANDLLEQIGKMAAEPLRLITLGRLEVWQGNRAISRQVLRTRRAGELLALLLIHRSHSLAYEEVVDALWPDRGPDGAQSLFHQATSSLRRALQPDLPDARFRSSYLEVESGRVTLKLPEGSWIDFEQMENAAHNGSWELALRLYQGDFLPGFLYAPWTNATRQRLGQLHQRALLHMAFVALQNDRLMESLDAAQRLLSLDPWHEQATLVAMQASVALHQTSTALRMYQQLAKALRDDLGIQPEAELQALYREILSKREPAAGDSE